MWLVLASLVCILRTIFVSSQDTTSQQNDIIPNQELTLPYGMFCYFTCSELIFQDRMQQVASSANRVSAARLVDLKMISSSASEPYESIWGALYLVQREDYQNIIQYASTQNSVAFVTTSQIETIENETAQCISTDFGLQPNAFPYTQSCDQCNDGGSANKPSMIDYRNELSSMGVPDSYFLMAGQLPTMQNSSPSTRNTVPQQQQPPTFQLQASGTGSAASGQPTSSNYTPTTPAYLPAVGVSTQARSMPNNKPQQQQLPQQPSSTYQPTSTGSVSGNRPMSSSQPLHQLENPYQNSNALPSTATARGPQITPYAPFQNQFVPQTPTPLILYSSAGEYQSTPSKGTNPTLAGYGTYQPQHNFSTGQSTTGNSQSQLIPGFTIASCSANLSNLRPQYGSTFTDYEASLSKSFTGTSINVGAGI